MFVVEIFVIGLTIGIFLTAVAVPIFIKKKTTTIDDLDEILAGLNEPLALSPKQEQYRKVKEKNKQIAPKAYPDSSPFQFTQQETDDAFIRMSNNIRKETGPKSEQDKFLDAINSSESYSYTGYKHGDKYEYSTDGHVFTVKRIERAQFAEDKVDTYVWGQREPIRTEVVWYNEPKYNRGHVRSKLKFYVAWDKENREAYFVATQASQSSFTSGLEEYTAITEQDYNAAYRAAQVGNLPWKVSCSCRSEFNNYIRRVVGAKFTHADVRKVYK